MQTYQHPLCPEYPAIASVEYGPKVWLVVDRGATANPDTRYASFSVVRGQVDQYKLHSDPHAAIDRIEALCAAWTA